MYSSKNIVLAILLILHIALIALQYSLYPISKAESISKDFTVFFELCRTAIENGTPLDTSQLTKIEVPNQQIRTGQSLQETWTLPQSELNILWESYGLDQKTQRHTCRVQILDDAQIVNIPEQSMMLREFMAIQSELIADETHEYDVSTSSLHGVINSAFKKPAKNPRGYCTVNTIFFNPDGSFFSASSGEKVIDAKCE